MSVFCFLWRFRDHTNFNNIEWLPAFIYFQGLQTKLHLYICRVCKQNYIWSFYLFVLKSPPTVSEFKCLCKHLTKSLCYYKIRERWYGKMFMKVLWIKSNVDEQLQWENSYGIVFSCNFSLFVDQMIWLWRHSL